MLTDTTIRQYRAVRASYPRLTARQALLQVRHEETLRTHSADWQELPNDTGYTWEEDGFMITAHVVPGECLDSYFGTFQGEYIRGAVHNPRAHSLPRHLAGLRRYRDLSLQWYIPMQSVQSVATDLHAAPYHYGRHEAYTAAYAGAIAELISALDYAPWCVHVEVSKHDITLGYDDLWGIDSSADRMHLLECITDCASIALANARDALRELRAE